MKIKLTDSKDIQSAKSASKSLYTLVAGILVSWAIIFSLSDGNYLARESLAIAMVPIVLTHFYFIYQLISWRSTQIDILEKNNFEYIKNGVWKKEDVFFTIAHTLPTDPETLELSLVDLKK